MGTLTLKTSLLHNVTMVSNLFLDKYMPRANGEFVKVYLLLLRTSARHGETLTLSSLADQLNCTENDICRAIHYWEREGLLLLETNGQGEITGLMLSAPEDDAPAEMPVVIDTGSTPARAESQELPRGKVSAERMKELSEKEESREINFIASQYLGKMLTGSEMQKLMYFYDTLHFTPELIEYLIEYCVSNGHKSFRYIEKVAYGWYEDGIKTVREARIHVNNYNRNYYDILKAFGISGRQPVNTEISYMKKWIDTYHLPIEIILEGCSRTVMRLGKASFSYADGILSNWHKSGVTTSEDVSRLDDLHEADTRRRSEEKKAPAKATAFDDFDQRRYDYDDLEQKLLKGN